MNRKIEVVDQNLIQRCLIIYHLADLLGQVKHDSYGNEQKQHHSKGCQVALQYVPIQYAHSYKRLSIFLTILAFHSAKSPAIIRLRASRTSQR